MSHLRQTGCAPASATSPTMYTACWSMGTWRRHTLAMSGTHGGALPPGVPATHKPFAVKHVHLFRVADDGRALEHWAVRDDLGLAMQAGLLPPPAGEGA